MQCKGWESALKSFICVIAESEIRSHGATPCLGSAQGLAVASLIPNSGIPWAPTLSRNCQVTWHSEVFLAGTGM